MQKITRAVGLVWAAPLTLLGLLYVSFFSVLCWCKFYGRYDDALVWVVDRSAAPKWFGRGMHCGRTMGNVILSATDPMTHVGEGMLRHEQEHVHQQMSLGVLYPVFYWFSSLGILFCRAAHYFYDNPFETDARRAAGQVIDVIGVVKHAIETGKIKVPPKSH